MHITNLATIGNRSPHSFIVLGTWVTRWITENKEPKKYRLMKRTGKQIQFCCSGALSLSPVLVKVPVNYYISTAAVYSASCFFCFLETSRNRAAGWHSSRARAVHQCWERLLRQVCTASTDLQLSPSFRKWQCSMILSWLCLSETLKLYITQVVVESAFGDRKLEATPNR